MSSVSPTSLQLQNSKAVIQAKDTSIQELKEKMAYLEAEVRALGSPREGGGLGGGVCLAAALRRVSGLVGSAQFLRTCRESV